ncbi:MAG TPA: DUF3800 domain-containing protein, partial [Rhodothermales bacterium]|nr:DUF3800 domain-containing protein [Rhodothermales bacterium]
WLNSEGFAQELKFNGVSKSNQRRYREFIERFIVSEGVLGFKAISMGSKGLPDEGAALADLYYFLIRRGIEHEHETGRAVLPRRITFVKDAEEAGFDDRLLALLRDRIEQASQTVFGGNLVLEHAYAEDSKAYVFLQIADLFTGCVSRVLNRPTQVRNWKDDFADDVLALLGVEQELNETEVLNDRAVHLSLRSPTLKGRLDET